MNCQHCQNPLPENPAATHCTFCGASLHSHLNSPYELSPVKFNGWRFLIALISPAVITLLTILIFRLTTSRRSDVESLALMVGFLASIVCGTICGVILGRRSRYQSTRTLLSVLFSCVMIIVCLTLSSIGCGIGFSVHY